MTPLLRLGKPCSYQLFPRPGQGTRDNGWLISQDLPGVSQSWQRRLRIWEDVPLGSPPPSGSRRRAPAHPPTPLQPSQSPASASFLPAQLEAEARVPGWDEGGWGGVGYGGEPLGSASLLSGLRARPQTRKPARATSAPPEG